MRQCSRDSPRLQTGYTQHGAFDRSTRHTGVPLQHLGLIINQRQTWRPTRGLPETSVGILRAWLFEHFLHPYPNDSEKLMLASQTCLTKNQPMIEDMYNEIRLVLGIGNLVHANPILNPLPMSVFILGIQYFIFGIADLFTFVGLLEFFYRESPKGFWSIGTAFAWCSMSMGYFLSFVLVHLINSVTENSKTGGWLKRSNINLTHLDLFYWALAILSLMNFFNYLYWDIQGSGQWK